jgi:trans-aconitate 2-methyltransferase
LSSRTTTDWDATNYDRLAAPQEAWARRVLERLPLEGGETVLDAGCGSGRVTRLLLEKLPDGRVIGVDGSPSMIEVAREAFADDDRVSLINSDLLELTPEFLREGAAVDSVDAVFSNATFHWIQDHARLFVRLHSVLRPGGRLVAQCGAEGNVQAFGDVVESVASEDPFVAHLTDWDRPWNFSSREDAERRLAAAGFDSVECWITDFEAAPEDPRAFMRASGLAPIFERLPAGLHDEFVDAVFAQLEEPIVFHYVRLNIDASRPE